MTELIFMYGFTASGKTTFAKNFVQAHPEKNLTYLSADEVRRELYGSQDHFGDPEEIYHILLDRMMDNLKRGRSVIYDACNLYRQFRMDYLEPIQTAGIECYKTCIRMNTMKETCVVNHAIRGRNFQLSKIEHYFDINEYPDMSEGWDWIYDVPDCKLATKKLYIASPFEKPEQRAIAIEVAEHYRALGHSVVLPLEHKFPNAYDMPNKQWGRAVFEYDIDAIRTCDYLVCLSYGRNSTAGTNWEAGFAYGIKKPVLVVCMPGVELMSLMTVNGCCASFNDLQELYEYDIHVPTSQHGATTEQK